MDEFYPPSLGNMDQIKLHWDTRHDGIEDVAWAFMGLPKKQESLCVPCVW